jgi:ACS family hexuronate transporter-like MFS transporter
MAILVFLFSSSLNYLQRQMLPALAPSLREEFHLSMTDYGWVLSVFSITYAASAPAVGLFIDRVGLNRGISSAVAVWSVASVWTGMAGGLSALLGARALLGFSQAAGVPSFGKTASLYLPPGERALGTAFSQVGISIGSIAAPLIAAWATTQHSWRAAFLVAGVLGFFWIPAWLWTAARVPRLPASEAGASMGIRDMLRSRQYWALLAATCLSMTIYSLWTNWVTIFLVREWGMDQAAANREFAWIPPLVATIGGLLGGAASLRMARAGYGVQEARMRVCLAGSIALLVTAFVPHMPGVAWATWAIAFSYLASTFFNVNLYAMPLDIFGPERSAFAIASLTMAYGLLQTFLSPLLGKIIDLYGFSPVCMAVAPLPLAALAILRCAR